MPQLGRPYSQGLSPRVRGNPYTITECTDLFGSIPACAGEPRYFSQLADKHEVYPRVCGGTSTGALYCLTVPGLSPRVRGNRANFGLDPAGDRSIPACAGEPAPSPPAME